MKNFVASWRTWPSAVVAALVLIAGPSLAATAPDYEMTDMNIADAIEDEMRFDPSVPLHAIDVSTADGIVTLDGRVSDLLAKERAESIARTVRGVRSVVNQIEVQPTKGRTDEAIRNDIVTSLTMDPATEAYELDVMVSNGRASLSGTVGSWAEKELAAKVAKSVNGVVAFDNNIDVEYKTTRSDYEIQNEIEKALEWDVLVDDGLIDVAVVDGEVELTGTVGSAAEKWRARTKAWVAGVKEVDHSRLEVSRWARDDDLRQHKFVVRPDSEIRHAVEDALARDPRVSSFNVETYVDDGVVTLRGVVGYLNAKRAAEQDAMNTVGAIRVENRIKVRPTSVMEDLEIESDVIEALVRDSTVEGYEVDVDVINGKVFLNGEVDSYFEKFHADDVASRVPGVISVRNNIDVEYDDPMTVYDPYVDSFYYPYGYGWYEDRTQRTTLRSDAAIKEDIEDELFWSPFVDADDVFVTVEDGVASLTGTVDSWAEERAAIENAYEGGATIVDNDLVVVRPTS